MHLQDVFSSRPVTWLGLFLAQHTPRRVGYGLARAVANAIARRRPEIYWTVRGNLRQILGPETDDDLLHEKTWQVFYHAGQTYYDFFHVVNQPLEALSDEVKIPKTLVEQIEAETTKGHGVLLLGTHISNFDLVGLALSAQGLSIQVLSLSDPQAGFHILNRLRGKRGFDITPITPKSLRAAIHRLKRGGLVLTGVDRPVPHEQALVKFFDRPAYLPLGPARLALITGAAVFVGSCFYDPDERYTLKYEGPVEIRRDGDRQHNVLTNTRRLAEILEKHVRACPEQWMMFHPFWPEASRSQDSLQSNRWAMKSPS